MFGLYGNLRLPGSRGGLGLALRLRNLKVTLELLLIELSFVGGMFSVAKASRLFFRNRKEITMTLMLVEDTLSEEEAVAQQFAPTVKCGWCGEIIRLDGNELALAMCQTCHDGMMAEFLAQQMNSANRHASDR
jgi:hypothetical protein